MIFKYNSIRFGRPKELPAELTAQVREYLTCFDLPRLNHGQLQQILLDFKDKFGQRMLINQLEPIFLYISREGKLWDTDPIA